MGDREHRAVAALVPPRRNLRGGTFQGIVDQDLLDRIIRTLESSRRPVFRAFLVLGALIDALLALFLLLVFGWVLDSWHDPNGAWVGIVVTTVWLSAFVLAAGAAPLAYRLTRRQSPPTRVALVVWLPVVVLVGTTIIGFMISPP